MTYRYLEHTADIIVEGDGRNLAEAIEETAAGIIERIGRADKESDSFEFEEHAESLDELIVYSLSYILTGCESRELQPHSFKVLELDVEGKEKKIKVRIGAGQGKAKDVVKAVTYHEVVIEQEKGKAVVRVLLDI